MIVLHRIAVAPYFCCPNRGQPRNCNSKPTKPAEKPQHPRKNSGSPPYRSLFCLLKSPQELQKLMVARTGDLFWGEITEDFQRLWKSKKMGINYTFFIWQGVNETKKVKNPFPKSRIFTLLIGKRNHPEKSKKN